jgi:2Fe-2S ferredoxin
MMAALTYIEHDGTTHEVRVPDGDSVMQGAVYNGIQGIIAECGGGLACATCHCYIDDAFLERVAPPSQTELDMLEAVAGERKPGSRLSCQITVDATLDGLIVRLPDKQY